MISVRIKIHLLTFLTGIFLLVPPCMKKEHRTTIVKGTVQDSVTLESRANIEVVVGKPKFSVGGSVSDIIKVVQTDQNGYSERRWC